VLDLTGSPAALGVLALFQFLPITVLTLFAWALVLTQRVEYWHVLVLAMVLGIASAFDLPARSVFVSQLVGLRRIGNAVALNSAMGNGARIVGPGLGRPDDRRVGHRPVLHCRRWRLPGRPELVTRPSPRAHSRTWTPAVGQCDGLEQLASTPERQAAIGRLGRRARRLVSRGMEVSWFQKSAGTGPAHRKSSLAEPNQLT
jgi:hypothetical protein